METQLSISEMLRDCDPCTRRDACVAIGETGDEGFVADLTGALRDEDAGVREAALNSLITIGGARVADAVAPLLKLEDATLRNIGIEILRQIGPAAHATLASLLKDKDDDVVKFAIDILMDTGDETSAGHLAGLIGHGNANVRASAALAAGKLKAASALSILTEALKDGEQWVRFSAIEGMGFLNDPETLKPLIEIIGSDKGLVREAAVDAVSKIATQAEAAEVLVNLAPLVREGSIVDAGAILLLFDKVFEGGSFRPSKDFKETYFQFFKNAADDCDWRVKLKGVRGLGYLRMPEGIAPALAFVESVAEIDDETEAAVINSIVSMSRGVTLPEILRAELAERGKALNVAIKVIGELKCAGVVGELESLIPVVSKEDLRDVIRALAAIGNEDATRVLYGVLESPDGHARKIAARGLCARAGEAAVEKVFEALAREVYRDVMEAMVDSLAEIQSESVVKGLTSLMSSENEALRVIAARGLGAISSEESVACLKRGIADPSQDVRKTAYESLFKLGVPEAEEMMASVILKEDDEVRLSLMKSLSGWGGDLVRDALLKALKDPNLWVRYNAVILLGERIDEQAEEALIEALSNDEPPVQAAAAKALEAAGSYAAIGVLERLLDHPDQTVREAVESALGGLRC